ncbi:MAG: hypothetical protein JXQ75_04640 [Phycisphaerae bacterium]|nr:hypothetical protein [Phycisphaerae bacterium]
MRSTKRIHAEASFGVWNCRPSWQNGSGMDLAAGDVGSRSGMPGLDRTGGGAVARDAEGPSFPAPFRGEGLFAIAAVRNPLGEPPHERFKPGGTRMESEEETEIGQVRRLPTLHFEDDEYFIDNRLRQFRTVTPPIRMIDFIEFEEERGRRMLEQCGWLTCVKCRWTFAVSRRSTIDETWCPECRRRVVIPYRFRSRRAPTREEHQPEEAIQ